MESFRAGHLPRRATIRRQLHARHAIRRELSAHTRTILSSVMFVHYLVLNLLYIVVATIGGGLGPEIDDDEETHYNGTVHNTILVVGSPGLRGVIEKSRNSLI